MEIFSGKGALYVGSKAKQPLERIPPAFAFVFVSKWRRNPVAWARDWRGHRWLGGREAAWENQPWIDNSQLPVDSSKQQKVTKSTTN